MKVIIVIPLLFISSLCFSQDYVDLVKLYYTITPENKFDSSESSTSIQEIGADITLPIVLKNENAIITGLMTEQITTKIAPGSKQKLSTYNLKLGYNINHSDKLSGTYMLLPKISSNMEGIESKDFQYGGLILLKIKKNNHLKYNAGIYYNNELFGPFIVPLIGLYYKSKNDKLEINATLPIWADVNYKLNSWLKLGTNFSAFVRSYNLSNYNSYVVKKTNELYSYLHFTLKSNFIIQTKTGYSIGRSYRAYNEEDKVDFGLSAFRFGDNRTLLNTDFSDGLIFKIRLIYRYHIKNKK